MKRIARAVILLSITFLACGCGDDKQPSTDSSSARDDTEQIATADTAKMYSYEVLNTVEYTGSGSFSQQAAGVMAVKQQPLESGQVAYTYSFVADTSPDGGKTIGQITLPAVTILRDPQTERIVGGTPLLKNLGWVANGSLNQIDGDLPLDGTTLTRSFRFDVPDDFPQDLSYKLTARPQTLETGVKAVAVLAVSEPFKYRSPGDKNRVTGQHRVLCLLTADTADVLYLCNNFIARAAEQGDIGELRIESLMVQLQDGKPISLAGLDAEFTRDFERLRLSETEAKQASHSGLPLWAMHSLAVRDMADITAGAAIEGAPNFAVVATVGMVLLVDSVVTTSTGLLHEAGVIDWQWKGLPNYAGRGVGLAAAKGFERATGKDANEEKWMDVVGLGGDVAALFIPSKALGAGVKLGSGGVKILKGQQLAGRSLRLSKHGLDLVRTSSGWQRNAKTVKALTAAQDLVNTVRLGVHLDKLAAKHGNNTESGETENSDRASALNAKRVIINSIGMKFTLIPAGEFMMGSPENAKFRYDDQDPVHRVKLTKPFYLGVHEVTQGEFEKVMGTSPWKGGKYVKEGSDYAASYISWDDAVEFCKKLSAKEGRTYRLPTEAEWEYACRAGSKTAYSFGADSSKLGAYAWNFDNAYEIGEKYAHLVGQKRANAFGLYDMHGNVWEWCQDWYDKEYYAKSPRVDPEGSSTDVSRVRRGGSWDRIGGFCRSALRNWLSPGLRNYDLGFRAALVPSE
ncbi:MAG: formylglycine-generating enzyme family protein [Planctomycetes bacterium]|nr:formylglycine-generating enzyme family protein [Planctomycetota bacterium]